MPKRVNRGRTQSVIPKEMLVREVARILDERGMTQTEASYAIRGTQSEISLIVNARTRGFSSARLLWTLTCLGRDVDIVLRKSKQAVGRVRILTGKAKRMRRSTLSRQ